MGAAKPAAPAFINVFNGSTRKNAIDAGDRKLSKQRATQQASRCKLPDTQECQNWTFGPRRNAVWENH
jgi:putative hemolysin